MPDEATKLLPAHRQLSRRLRAWVIGAVAVAVAGAAAFGFVYAARHPGPTATDPGTLSPRSGPPSEVEETDEEAILAQAQSFLRKSATGNVVEACLPVTDNGGILNPCENDLKKRTDFKTLRRLDPNLEVIGFDRSGDVVTITGKHLQPATTVKFSIQVMHTDRGEWKVRKLNGRPITYEGDFEVR